MLLTGRTVGRTGSGKVSVFGLDVLRSNVTIIPQTVRQLTFFTQPELLSGSLQENLNLFSQYDDATLNRAPRALGLLSLQSDEESRLTLDSQIASGRSNLTVGQQQILALARALVHGSKLLVLDEGASPLSPLSSVGLA
ncbi:ATP-binding cassette subfamily C member 1 [Lactarius psammicola]|nr:ATP-binding cassette subfamily C member 1 [Lactarius psammicola]